MDNFTKIECYKCGIVFAVSSERQGRLLKTKESFWCPSGHEQAYVGETEEQRLRKLVIEKNSMIYEKDREIEKLKNPPKKKKVKLLKK